MSEHLLVLMAGTFSAALQTNLFAAQKLEVW